MFAKLRISSDLSQNVFKLLKAASLINLEGNTGRVDTMMSDILLSIVATKTYSEICSHNVLSRTRNEEVPLYRFLIITLQF